MLREMEHQRQETNQVPVTPWEQQEAELQRVMKAWGGPRGATETALKALVISQSGPPEPELTDKEWLAQQKIHLKELGRRIRAGEGLLVQKPRSLADRKSKRAIRESQERAQQVRLP